VSLKRVLTFDDISENKPPAHTLIKYLSPPNPKSTSDITPFKTTSQALSTSFGILRKLAKSLAVP